MLSGFALQAPLRAQMPRVTRPMAQGAESIPPGPRLENYSWTYIPQPTPREFAVEDIVFIRVNELARMESDGEMQGRRNASYDAVLLDWVYLRGLEAIKPSPQRDGDQRVQGRLNELYRAQGEMETSERLSFNIAAKIVDIRPNGNLVLEAHKQVRVNREVWDVCLSGTCRAEDIADNNMILSERVYGLRIKKEEIGHVRDAYKRGWFIYWFDQFKPF